MQLLVRPRSSLCLLLLLGLLGTASCAASIEPSSEPLPSALTFSDVPDNHRFAEAIDDLAGRGILSGFSDGTFRPGEGVTRQQFAKIIVSALGFIPSEDDVWAYPDVSPTASLYPSHYIAVATENGLMSGYKDGLFRPKGSLTRAHLLLVLQLVSGSILSQPPDTFECCVRAKDGQWNSVIAWAEFNGLLAGISELAEWNPGERATRGEVSQVLHNLLVLTDYQIPFSVSVRAYGAKGDGWDDDSVAIQRAIDARPSGGPVTLPRGTYHLQAPLHLRTNTSILGSSDSIVEADQVHAFLLEDVHNVVLDGITIRGAYEYEEQQGVGMFTVSQVTLRDLTIEDMGFSGIYSNGSATQVTIEDCIITNCGDFGIHLQGGYCGVTIARVIASGFASRLYPGHAVYLKDGRDFSIVDSVLGGVYGSAEGLSAIQIGYGASNGRLTGNTVHDSEFGIMLWGYEGHPTTGIELSGNTAYNNSRLDFYEYGGEVDALWGVDNRGTFGQGGD